jgi:hypothetical protein
MTSAVMAVTARTEQGELITIPPVCQSLNFAVSSWYYRHNLESRRR